MGQYNIKPPIYEKFIEENVCICSNGMFKMNSCIYAKLFWFM